MNPNKPTWTAVSKGAHQASRCSLDGWGIVAMEINGIISKHADGNCFLLESSERDAGVVEVHSRVLGDELGFNVMSRIPDHSTGVSGLKGGHGGVEERDLPEA